MRSGLYYGKQAYDMEKPSAKLLRTFGNRTHVFVNSSVAMDFYRSEIKPTLDRSRQTTESEMIST